MLRSVDGGMVNGVFCTLLVGVGIRAVTEVAGIVVVQQVVVARLAFGIDFVRQRAQVIQNRKNTRRVGIGTVAVGSAADTASRRSRRRRPPPP